MKLSISLNFIDILDLKDDQPFHDFYIHINPIILQIIKKTSYCYRYHKYIKMNHEFLYYIKPNQIS